MSETRRPTTRRAALKKMGTLGAAALVGAVGQAGESPAPSARAAETSPPADERRARSGRSSKALVRPAAFLAELEQRVARTPIVDTHEHLPDEDERLRGEKIACDDWGLLFSHYIDSDLIVAGMPREQKERLLTRGVDPVEKWRALAPYWPAVKNTGYGRAIRIALRDLYGIDDLDQGSVSRLQQSYEAVRRPGLYQKALVETARIESCQVNYLWRAFKESRQPTLLTQDLSFLQMHVNLDVDGLSKPAGIEVRSLDDWHAVIRWWFEKYGPYAVAVKSQAAYGRSLDYEKVPPEEAAPVFLKQLRKEEPASPEERKRLEDHLFWFCVEQATRHGLPVKLHTGYYAGQNGMPLGRIAGNPSEATDLCRKSPETTFVFMHIGYPRWQDMVAVAKHYTNAVIDMCWAWIIDPAGAKEFLKSFLVTAPSNKVLPFGGDYIPIECVVGHASLARRGITRAFWELVDEGWLGREDALELVEPILRGNARRIFRLEEKLARLEKAPWL